MKIKLFECSKIYFTFFLNFRRIHKTDKPKNTIVAWDRPSLLQQPQLRWWDLQIHSDHHLQLQVSPHKFWVLTLKNLGKSGSPAHTHTRSTIRNWHKVKTWLDQMFWQIYQKLMLSCFVSSGNLCQIHHLKLFWPHTASTASDRKGAKIQHEFWWFCQKIFFQNIKIKSSNYWIQESGRLWSPQ